MCVDFFKAELFCSVGFLDLSPRGPGSNLVDCTKLTPLIIWLDYEILDTILNTIHIKTFRIQSYKISKIY